MAKGCISVVKNQSNNLLAAYDGVCQIFSDEAKRAVKGCLPFDWWKANISQLFLELPGISLMTVGP